MTRRMTRRRKTEEKGRRRRRSSSSGHYCKVGHDDEVLLGNFSFDITSGLKYSRRVELQPAAV